MQKGKLTKDGNHRTHSQDPVDNTIYYKNLETGNLEFIGSNGEWVEA